MKIVPEGISYRQLSIDKKLAEKKAKRKARKKNRIPHNKYVDYLKSSKWKNKRKQILNLRGSKCEKCSGENNLQIHHLTYKNLGNEPLDDLQILCRGCHTKVHADKNIYDG